MCVCVRAGTAFFKSKGVRERYIDGRRSKKSEVGLGQSSQAQCQLGEVSQGWWPGPNV